MDLNALRHIIDVTTQGFRKGEPIEEHQAGVVHVVEVNLDPPIPATTDLTMIDVHFLVVGVDKEAAEVHREELVALLKAWPQPDRLSAGPSYIEVGGELGDQGLALRLYALGEVLGLWKVITPEVLGFTGKQAHELAGRGFVMTSGFTE